MRSTVSRRPAGSRTLIVLALTAMLVVSLATDATAVGDWDRRGDVRGRYDFRWIGATITRAGWVQLTVSFYAGFRIRDLPRRGTHPGVTVDIDEYFTGWFTRNRSGWVKFGYADLGSFCCNYYPVKILSPRTLRVRFEPVNEGPPGFPMRGVSVWGGRHGPKDWTSVIRLRGLPPP